MPTYNVIEKDENGNEISRITGVDEARAIRIQKQMDESLLGKHQIYLEQEFDGSILKLGTSDNTVWSGSGSYNNTAQIYRGSNVIYNNLSHVTLSGGGVEPGPIIIIK
jgi:hypothetical protein